VVRIAHDGTRAGWAVKDGWDKPTIKVRALNVTWKEVVRDLERAIEFDQSQLFKKVYTEEFGTPGGEPFGLLLGDYVVQHKPSADHPHDDLSALSAISQVAAGAFAPFITSVHPSFFDLTSWISNHDASRSGRSWFPGFASTKESARATAARSASGRRYGSSRSKTAALLCGDVTAPRESTSKCSRRNSESGSSSGEAASRARNNDSHESMRHIESRSDS
jgi:hypothetical protein